MLKMLLCFCFQKMTSLNKLTLNLNSELAQFRERMLKDVRFKLIRFIAESNKAEEMRLSCLRYNDIEIEFWRTLTLNLISHPRHLHDNSPEQEESNTNAPDHQQCNGPSAIESETIINEWTLSWSEKFLIRREVGHYYF